MKLELNETALMVCPDVYAQIVEQMNSGAVPAWNGKRTKGSGSVAVVPIFGIIAEQPHPWRPDYFAAASEIVPALEKLANDPAVSEIILLMDTPGGSCKACDSISYAVQKAAAKKRVETFVDGYCCSAGVHIAAYSHKITAMQGSIVGSVGVISTYYDTSKMFDEFGIKPVVLTTGNMKAMGLPGVKITEEQQSLRMKLIEDLCDQFKLVLMEHRKLTEQQVEKLAEKGDIWLAPQAKQFGLVDAIDRWDTFYESRTGATSTDQPTKQDQGTKSMDPQEKMKLILQSCDGISEEKDSEFILKAVLSDKTVEQIASEWNKARYEALVKENTRMQAELDAAKKKDAEQADTPPAGNPPGGKMVETNPKDPSSGDPEKDWMDALHKIQAEHHARGETLSLQQASKILYKRNPALQEAYLNHCRKNPRPGWKKGWNENMPDDDIDEMESLDDLD